MLIVGNIIGSLFWGVLMAIVIIAIIMLLCFRMMRNVPPIVYVILLMLLVFLGIQSTLMVGALYAKGYVNDIGNYANSLVSVSKQEKISAADYESLFSQITDEFPIVKPVLDILAPSEAQEYVAQGHTIVDYITDNTNKSINNYIFRRVYWITGGIVIAILCIGLLGRRSLGGRSVRLSRPMVVQRRPRVNTRRR